MIKLLLFLLQIEQNGIFVDIGILQIGAQNVPIYPTISKEDYEYVLNHSEAIYCFASDISIVEKLNKIKGNTSLKEIFTFDDIADEKSLERSFKLRRRY